MASLIATASRALLFEPESGARVGCAVSRSPAVRHPPRSPWVVNEVHYSTPGSVPSPATFESRVAD
jgi:hypothetical protein